MLEERPEPRRKEHNFGHDKQYKAIAKADADNWRVIPDPAFQYHVAPPAEHHVQDRNKTTPEQERCHAVHPEHSAK